MPLKNRLVRFLSSRYQRNSKHIFGSSTLNRALNSANEAIDRPLTIVILFLVGILRATFVFLAYAPAHGADSYDYLLYAAFMNGADLPTTVAQIKPLYPIFIALNEYLLGNFFFILTAQYILLTTLSVMIYLGLKRYSPLFALSVAIFLLIDMQVAFVFPYIATEALYLPLLLSIYTLVMRAKPQDNGKLHYEDVLLALVLVLAWNTRTVVTLLWIPVFAVFAMQVRQWKRITVTLLVFISLFLCFDLTVRLFDISMTSNEGSKMYIRPLLADDLLNEQVGEANATIIERQRTCEEQGKHGSIIECLQDTTTDTGEMNTLLRQAYFEVFWTRTSVIINRVIDNYIIFFVTSGVQHHGNPTPADVQCEDVTRQQAEQIDFYINYEWRNIDLTVKQVDILESTVRRYAEIMCPPSQTYDALQNVFDGLQALLSSTPNFIHIFIFTDPKFFYGIALASVTLIPALWRFWLPTVTAFGILSYHALISAVLNNVQARYIVVTNPFRHVIVVVWLTLVLYCVLKLVDVIMVRVSATNATDVDA